MWDQPVSLISPQSYWHSCAKASLRTFFPKTLSNKRRQDCVIKVFTSHDVRVNADMPLSGAVLGKCRTPTEQRRLAGHSGAAAQSLSDGGCGRGQRHWQLAECLVERHSAGECRREPETNHEVLPDRVAALLRGCPSSADPGTWQRSPRAEISATRLAIRPNTPCSASANLCGHLTTHHGHQGPRVPLVHLQAGSGR